MSLRPDLEDEWNSLPRRGFPRAVVGVGVALIVALAVGGFLLTRESTTSGAPAAIVVDHEVTSSRPGVTLDENAPACGSGSAGISFEISGSGEFVLQQIAGYAATPSASDYDLTFDDTPRAAPWCATVNAETPAVLVSATSADPGRSCQIFVDGRPVGTMKIEPNEVDGKPVTHVLCRYLSWE